MSYINWLKSGPTNVLELKFRVHHAPVYLTTVETGQILDYEYPIDTPSMDDDDITIAVKGEDSVSRQIGNAVDISKINIQDSPYAQKQGYDVIPDNHAILYERDNMHSQYIVELQNNQPLVYDTNLNEFFAPHPQMVRDKIHDPQENTQRVPISAAPISSNSLLRV